MSPGVPRLFDCLIILMAITFLHAADIHLDSPLKGLERYENAPVGSDPRGDRRAFTRLIDLAIEKRVDFVLIAGDLYDGDWRDYNTGLYLSKRARPAARREDPGLHHRRQPRRGQQDDPRACRCPRTSSSSPTTGPRRVRLDDLDVAIHGQSFAKARRHGEPGRRAIRPPIPGCFNIGLLHTGLGGADGHERYAPCTLEELRLKGYDYWALGHIHTRQVALPGPAGRLRRQRARPAHPRDGPERVPARRPSIRIGSVEQDFHRLDQVRWERMPGRGLGAGHRVGPARAARPRMLDGLLASEPDPDVLLTVRVILGGTSSLHGRLNADPERFVNEFRSLATERGGDRLWVEKVEFQLRPPQRRDRARRPDRGARSTSWSSSAAIPRACDAGRRRAGRSEAQAAGGVPPRPRQPATRRGGVAADPAGPGAAAAPGPAPQIPGRRRQWPRLDLT